MPATSNRWPRRATATGIRISRSISATAPAIDGVFASFQPDAVLHLAAESHVDRSIDGAGALHRDQRRRHLHAARGGARLLAQARRRGPRSASASTTSRPTRCSARSAPTGKFSETTPYAAQLALFRQQGRVRPSGARLAPHLRPADAGHQLLEQLRALSLPREADPADHHPRAARREPAGLRQGRERARLAACRGPCRGAARWCCARAGPARPTTSAATASARTSTSCARSARCSTRCCPTARTGRTSKLIEFVTDRPGHDARYAIDAAKIQRRARLAAAPRLRGRAAPDRALVPRPQGLVGAGHERRLSRRATAGLG